MQNKSIHWYSMTAVYHWEAEASRLPKFERRITICSGASEEEAEAALMKEAEEYQTDTIKLLDNYTTQKIDETPSMEPIEVAHEMGVGIDTNSGNPIAPGEFMSHFNVSRIESCDLLGLDHCWFNQDGENSGCCNCKEVRQGRLWETPIAEE